MACTVVNFHIANQELISSLQLSADTAARAARLEWTRASAKATGWARIRQETGQAREDSGRRFGNRRPSRCEAALQRRAREWSAQPCTLRQVSGRWWRNSRDAQEFVARLPFARFRRERERSPLRLPIRPSPCRCACAEHPEGAARSRGSFSDAREDQRVAV